MVINFDIFDNFEKPNITLCNPNKREIASMGAVAFDIQMTLRYNSMSEISMTIPIQTKKGSKVNFYNEVKSKRLISVDNFGYFLITTVNKVGNGIREVKEITAYSLEAELNYKKINLFSGTYKFYDPISPNNTLLGQIIKYIPSWSIGYIDSDLWNKYRTFDISDQTIYNFLMNDVENAFECIFTYSTEDKKINAYAVQNAVKDTSIYLSFNNLLKDVQIEEMSEELVTALHCYGSGDLDIRTVNPLGSPIIYNFDYFLYSEDEWFSEGLRNSVIAWNSKVALLQPTYANYLTNYRTKNQEYIILQGQLVDLQSEYTAIEAVQKARIEAGQSYSDIYPSLVAKQTEINNKKSEIEAKKNEIILITDSLKGVNEQLSFANNFTEEEYKELNNYVIEGTYQNEAFVETTQMTAVEIQDMAQELYDQSKNVLVKLSQPRFSFSLNSANFLFLKEFKPFSDQLSLGSQINIDIGEGLVAYPVLLELQFSWDNPTNFNMTFGNRLRLDKNDFVFSELFGDSVNSATSVSFNSNSWGDWSKNYEDEVSQFINSSLDCAKNSVINATNQEIVIDSNGLKGQKYIPEQDIYSPKKVWLTSSTLAFTDNNWQTAKLAIGEIQNGIFGIVGDVIVGKILAGNQLQITNSNNNFLLDANGCILNNASFTLTTSNNKGKIILDASQGIKIQGNTGTGFEDKFFVDTSGNVNFTGKLNGATGSFSGELTSATFKSGSININEKFKVDALGNCTATSISITGGNFSSGNIVGGTISGSHITTTQDILVGKNLKINVLGSGNGEVGFYDGSRYICGIQGIEYFRGSNDILINNAGIRVSGNAQINGSLNVNGMAYFQSIISMQGDLVATQKWVNSQLPSRTTSYSGGNHNHGIPDGTVLAKAGGGSVTWSAYDGFSHRHDI